MGEGCECSGDGKPSLKSFSLSLSLRGCVCRAEQRRVPAAWEGLVCERQLDVGGRTAGGGEHGHRTEAGVGDAVTALQARPVQPLEQTAPQGGDKPRSIHGQHACPLSSIGLIPSFLFDLTLKNP